MCYFTVDQGSGQAKGKNAYPLKTCSKNVFILGDQAFIENWLDTKKFLVRTAMEAASHR